MSERNFIYTTTEQEAIDICKKLNDFYGYPNYATKTFAATAYRPNESGDGYIIEFDETIYSPKFNSYKSNADAFTEDVKNLTPIDKQENLVIEAVEEKPVEDGKEELPIEEKPIEEKPIEEIPIEIGLENPSVETAKITTGSVKNIITQELASSMGFKI